MRLATLLLFSALCISTVSFAQESEIEKLSIPSEADQKEATARIKDVYKADFDQASKLIQKTALAQKFIETAIQTQGDPAGQYVLLEVARDVAAESEDVPTALLAIDSMDKRFKIDDLKVKADVLMEASKGRRNEKLSHEIASTALAITNEAVASDRYDLADELITIARKAARRSANASLIKLVKSKNKQIKDTAAAYLAAEDAKAILVEKPADPKANLVVGTFRCFRKGDWTAGLPMLAVGQSETLRKLAKIDLAQPSAADAQTQLADGWWGVADKLDGIQKVQTQIRAAKWYREALPNLTGLAKDKATGRMALAKAERKELVVDQKSVSKQGSKLTGSQTTDSRTLLRADNPHLLGGIYRVTKGQELVIEPGVEIVCGPDSQLLVIGKLTVSGTEEQPVVFRGHQSNPKFWKGVSADVGGGLVLNHARLSDAETAVQSKKTKVKLTGCLIVGNRTGVSCNGRGSDLLMSNCVAAWNTGNGVITFLGPAEFDHCSLAHNGEWGLFANYNPNFRIKDSVIVGNQEGGIFGKLYDSKKIVVSGCVIGGNRNVQVKNTATGDWDFQNNFWDKAVVAWMNNPIGEENTKPIRGNVRVDNPLKKAPEDCGASVRKIGKRTIW